MKNDLVAPCSMCPFRRDVGFYLAPERVREIAAKVSPGAAFVCHQTIDYDRAPDPDGLDDEDPTRRDYDARERLCAGALAFTLNTGDEVAHNVVAIRMDCDARKLARIEASRSSVWTNLDEWLRAMRASRRARVTKRRGNR